MKILGPLLALTLVLPAQAEPHFSIDITLGADADYDAAVDTIRQADATATSLTLYWDEGQDASGRYVADPDWAAIAGGYYPGQDIAISLTLSVIDTVTDRRPEDLRARDWSDPVVIDRFVTYAEAVLERMQDVEITGISVGNEVNGYLSSPKAIADYARFLTAVRDRLRPIAGEDVPIGTKLIWTDLRETPDRWQPVIDASDALMVTYYPLGPGFLVMGEPVAPQFDRMIALAEGRPVHILEAGMPSDGCGSTERDQSAFVYAAVTEWEARQSAIPHLSLTWLTDRAPEEIAAYQAYYGVGDACFGAYLASLGLRGHDGRAKPALDWLMSR
ncbi:MAG: hypothetical protein ACPGID_13190 [Rubricella sp.]